MRRLVLTIAACALTSCGTGARDAPAPAPRSEIGALPQVSAPALSQTLARELGGEWKAGKGLVYTAPGKGLMFQIHYASCQQPQGVVLERYASWMRPMAIIWAANGWTVVSDAEAWRLDRAKVLKLVAILERTRPDYETWKTARETADEADKPEKGEGK